MNRNNSLSVTGHLIDPITGRRYLPKGYTWIGNGGNVEDFTQFPDFNCRDLRARFYLLAQIVKYVLNSRLIIPTKNKYMPNAQAIDEIIDNAILKHRNGVIKQAIAGVDYVDYKKLTDDYICITHPYISGQSNKFIDVSNLRVGDIENFIEDYEQFKVEFKAEIKAEIELALQPIVNVVNNVNVIITNLPDIIRKTVHEHITNEITQEITDVIQQTINTQEIIEQIIQNIKNSEYGFNFDEFLNELTIKIELLNRFIESLQQNFNELSIEFNLSNDIIQYLTETVNNLNEQITNITNNYGGNIEINPDLNPNIDIGDLEIQLTELLTAFANFQAYVNMALFSIFPLITNLQNECIAWDLAHDQLQINATDPITDQDYTFSGKLSPGRIYHNLKTWSEHQFFTFEHGVNPRFIIRSDFSNLNDKQRLSDARSVGLSILSNSFSGWSFSLAPKTHSNLLRVNGEQLLISPVFHNEEQNPIIGISPDEIGINKPVLIPTPEINANMQQVVNIRYLQEHYQVQISNLVTELDNIQNGLSTNNTQISTLQIDYNTLSNQVTNNTNDVNSLDTRVTTLEQEVQQSASNNSQSTNNNQSSFTILPQAFTPPIKFQAITCNVTSPIPNVTISWDSIACHPKTGQWVIGSSNVPGVTACSDDDGTTWQLLPQISALSSSVGLVITPTGDGWFIANRNSDTTFGRHAWFNPNLDIKQTANAIDIQLPSTDGEIQNCCYDYFNNIVYFSLFDRIYYAYQTQGQISSFTSIQPNSSLSTSSPSFIACNYANGHVMHVQQDNNIYTWLYNGSVLRSRSISSSTGQSSFAGITSTSTGGFAFAYSYAGSTNPTTYVTTTASMTHRYVSTWYNDRTVSSAGSAYAGGFIIASHWFSSTVLYLDPLAHHYYDMRSSSLVQFEPQFTPLVGSNAMFITGGDGRTSAFSVRSGKTIILSNSNVFLSC